jgi:hypothetical protein
MAVTFVEVGGQAYGPRSCMLEFKLPRKSTFVLVGC